MPGRASLEAQRYYAYRHNQFWPIMAELLGFDVSLPYAKRCLELRRAGIAVWDVLQQCERPGSLDSAIVESSIVPNDFPGLLKRCPRLRHVFFNGAKAEHSFRRYVLPAFCETSMAFARLPSTSPANAGQTIQQKREAWSAILMAVERASE